jgi:hypothetical protein
MLIPTAPLPRPGTKSWANEFRATKSVLSLVAGFIPVVTIIGVICFRGLLDAPDASAKKQVRFSALDELSRSIHTDSVNSQFEGCFINVSGQLPCNHGGSLAELPDGSLVCTWYAASSEAKVAGPGPSPKSSSRPKPRYKGIGSQINRLVTPSCSWIVSDVSGFSLPESP